LLMLPISFFHFQKLKKQSNESNIDLEDDSEDIL
jgi:hypothetical protein